MNGTEKPEAENRNDGSVAADDSLTNSRRLGGNIVWNLSGMGVPILIALFAIPPLIGLLGEARFGILTIAWLVFGYFSMFDLGLHRALTQLVSKALIRNQSQYIASLFWTSMFLMVIAGLFVAMLLYFGTPSIVEHLKIPEELSALMRQEIQAETRSAFIFMAIGLPILTSTMGLRGMLEAHQKFSTVALIQLWHGTWTFLGPLLIAWLFKPDLAWIVGGLLAGRLITWAVYFVAATRAAPQVWTTVGIDRSVIKPLLTYGCWMALTHTVVPIILYGDRFLIGTIIDTEAVTHYVTPAEIVLKVLIIPNAIVGVLFPAFAMTFDNNRMRMRELFSDGITGVILLLLPVTVVVVTLAPELLSIWIGIGLTQEATQVFTQISYPVFQLLAIGVLINGFSLIPTALIQASGKPSWIAILYCIELPIWYFSMVWLTESYGIVGTAFAWLARQVFDLMAVLFLCRRLVNGEALNLTRAVMVLLISSILLLLITLLTNTTTRLAVGSFTLLGSCYVGWIWLLSAEQREKLLAFLRITLNRKRA